MIAIFIKCEFWFKSFIIITYICYIFFFAAEKYKLFFIKPPHTHTHTRLRYETPAYHHAHTP